jgi:hypothetical protein
MRISLSVAMLALSASTTLAEYAPPPGGGRLGGPNSECMMNISWYNKGFAVYKCENNQAVLDYFDCNTGYKTVKNPSMSLNAWCDFQANNLWKHYGEAWKVGPGLKIVRSNPISPEKLRICEQAASDANKFATANKTGKRYRCNSQTGANEEDTYP